ncbi:MAG: FAD-dependent oxidoreductase [Chloroflexota bacterium]
MTEGKSRLPESRDDAADVVVVGAGGSGVAAAWEAANAGASVLIIEKTSSGGGSSILSGGNFAMAGTRLQQEKGIKDSVELFRKDMHQYTGVWARPEEIKAHAQGSHDAFEWLVGLGAHITEVGWYAEHSVPRSHKIKSGEVYSLVRRGALAKGARLLTETRAQELVRDATGRVVGVRVSRKGETVNIGAKKAVVLATGGFSHDKEMLLNHYGPGLENFVIAASETHTGEGTRMALAVGADTTRMAMVGRWGTPKHPVSKRAVVAIQYGAIVVNAAGKRFDDESEDVHYFPVRVQAQQPRALGWQVYDRRIAGVYEGGQPHKYALEASTINELAAQMNVPPEALAATIDKYNRDIAAEGFDTVFGRKNLEKGPPARGELIPIDTPPFYAIETYPSLTETQGGIKIDYRAQVIDVFGRAIPGLYAAGELAQPVLTGGGMFLGGAYIFGRIAGRNAAAENPD